MSLTTANFVGFGRAELEKIFGSFGLAHHVNGLVVVFNDRPIRVVFSDWCLDLEFPGKLYKKPNVFALVQLLSTFSRSPVKIGLDACSGQPQPSIEHISKSEIISG